MCELSPLRLLALGGDGNERGWVTENGVIDSRPSLHPLPLPSEDRKVICEFMETASRDSLSDDRHRSFREVELGRRTGKAGAEARKGI